MQKAVKLIVLGMAMGMAIEKCFMKKISSSTDEPSISSCKENDSCFDMDDCTPCSKKKTKLDLLIEEFNKIDLSDVKEKTKQALERFRNKLQSM